MREQEQEQQQQQQQQKQEVVIPGGRLLSIILRAFLVFEESSVHDASKDWQTHRARSRGSCITTTICRSPTVECLGLMVYL